MGNTWFRDFIWNVTKLHRYANLDRDDGYAPRNACADRALYRSRLRFWVLERASVSHVRHLKSPKKGEALGNRVPDHRTARYYLRPNLGYELIDTQDLSATQQGAVRCWIVDDSKLLKL